MRKASTVVSTAPTKGGVAASSASLEVFGWVDMDLQYRWDVEWRRDVGVHFVKAHHPIYYEEDCRERENTDKLLALIAVHSTSSWHSPSSKAPYSGAAPAGTVGCVRSGSVETQSPKTESM